MSAGQVTRTNCMIRGLGLETLALVQSLGRKEEGPEIQFNQVGNDTINQAYVTKT